MNLLVAGLALFVAIHVLPTVGDGRAARRSVAAHGWLSGVRLFG